MIRIGAFLSGWVNPAERPGDYISRLLDRVPAIREAGFASVWVGQHPLGHPWPVLDTTAYLGRLSASLGGMEMGGVYLLPFAHPVQLAETLVSLDNLSQGQFIACPALGWRPGEFEAMGVPINERVARFTESLAIMRLLWHTSEPVSHQGRFYQFTNVRLAAKAQRAGGIPMWIGASSAPAVKRAACLGDAWLGSSHTPFEQLRTLSAAYGAELAAQGKRAERRPLLRHCMVAATDAIAEQRFAETFSAYYKALGTWGIFKEVVGEKHQSRAGELPPGRAIVGSPETAVAQLKRYTELGFNEFVFQVGLPGTPEPHVREAIQLLGQAVLPALRAA